MRISINFSPKEHIFARKAYAALALCMFVAASAFAACYGVYSGAEARIEPLNAKVAALEAGIKGIDLKLVEVRKTVDPGRAKSDALEVAFVNGAIKQKAFSWTTFLDRVEALVPEGVGITSIRPEFTTLNVEIAGNADGVGNALQFVERLTKSPYFDDIPPVFHTAEVVVDKDIGKSVQQFSVKIKYYPEGRPGAVPPAGQGAASGNAAGGGG